MGRRRYFVALLAMALWWFAAGSPALAQIEASSLRQSVAEAVARDLQLTAGDQASQLQILAPATMSLPARAIARGLGAGRVHAGKLAGARGLYRSGRLPAVPCDAALSVIAGE